MVTETWLTEEHYNSELFPPHYVVYRCDRDPKLSGCNRGGGVLIAVSQHYSQVNSRNFCTKFIESCWLVLSINGIKFLLGVIYIVPNTPILQYVQLFEFITSLIHSQDLTDAKLFIIGDFNFRQNSYDNLSLPDEILHHLLYLRLKQYNSILNHQLRFLDLVLSDTRVTVSRCSEPVVKEDNFHPALTVDIPIMRSAIRNHKTSSSSKCLYQFHLGDYDLLYQLISNTNFDSVFNNEIDESINNFYNKMYDAMNAAIPRKYVTYDPHYPIWFTLKIIKLIKKKNKIRKTLKKYATNCNSNSLCNFKTLRSAIKREIKTAKANYTARAESSFLSNPKQVWNFVNQTKRETVSPSLSFDGRVFSDPADIANQFSILFSRAYSNNTCKSPSSDFSTTSTIPCFSLFSEDEVNTAFNKLKGSKCCGPDSLPSFILKACKDILVKPLTHIFNQCLQKGYFPTKWKLSRVSPIFKKGDKTVGENYRPISILCATSKIFELLLYNRIYSDVKCQISPFQHGFIQGRSTITNLVTFTDFVATCFEHKKAAHAIYFDYSKAFDTVDHSLLLSKLENNFNVCSYILRILDSYLQNREQYVL